MDKTKLEKMIEAAKMYYQLDYNQQEIARRLGVSRPTVSRLLKQAKEDGIVDIRIYDPAESKEKLAQLLAEQYRLKEVCVASVPQYEELDVKQYLGEETAQYLERVLKDRDILAVSWGTTLYEAVSRVKPKHVKQLKVVQLNGGVSHSGTRTYATEIVQLLGDAYRAETHLLPLPAIVDHREVKRVIEADRHIRRVLEMGRTANLALYSVGVPSADAVIVQAEYLSEADQAIIEERAVGEICSRFFDEKGTICHKGLDARTIGIELDELKKKERAILVAGGPRKLEAIYGALRGGYANVLITDQYTAQALLKKSDLESDHEFTLYSE